RRGQDAEAQFAPADRVLNTGDRIALVEVPDAGLVAGNAGADVFGRAASRLVGHFRIADQRPRHAAHVGVIPGNDGFRILRLVDPARHEHRNPGLALDAGRIGNDVPGFHGHGRRDVDGAAEARGSAERDVHVVDAVIETAHGVEALVLRQTRIVDFRSRYTQSHHEAGIHLGAYVGDDLAQEAQPAVHIAAVGIVAQVHARVQK